MTEEELINEILEIIKDRILIAEKRKEEYALDIEMASFWDGELRCAQDLLNKISKASKGKKDEPMKEPLPCPFCGVIPTPSEAINHEGVWAVVCANFDKQNECDIKPATRWYISTNEIDGKEAAIEAWNKRGKA